MIPLSKSITGKQKNTINKDRDKLCNGKVFLALVLDFFDFFIIYLTNSLLSLSIFFGEFVVKVVLFSNLNNVFPRDTVPALIRTKLTELDSLIVLQLASDTE